MRPLRFVALAILLFVSPAATGISASPPPVAIQAEARSTDGDTLAISIRLSGVDAFERSQACEDSEGRCWACGRAAQAYLREQLGSGGSREVAFRFTGDASYGRPVATVLVDGEDVGLKLIEAGWALAAPNYLREDPARAARYVAAEAEARALGRGGFSGRWLPPAKWRHGARLGCERPTRS